MKQWFSVKQTINTKIEYGDRFGRYIIKMWWEIDHQKLVLCTGI